MSPIFRRRAQPLAPAAPPGAAEPQPQVHDAFITRCIGMNEQLRRICDAPIAVPLDMGPAIFRCPVCDALWCVDPISRDYMDFDVAVMEDIHGHRIEVFGQAKSRPL